MLQAHESPIKLQAKSWVLSSPVGALEVRSNGEALTMLAFKGIGERSSRPKAAADPILTSISDELDAYFSGQLRSFATPLSLTGTPFQIKVWTALREIPYGRTRSYADVARTIGQPTAMRAVGAANGANPIAIVVPCHRVIGAKGALVGFGGGLDCKRKLLELEGVFLPLNKLKAL